jgi:beta-lactamase regulating signal transducer with metallopeptidase domain
MSPADSVVLLNHLLAGALKGGAVLAAGLAVTVLLSRSSGARRHLILSLATALALLLGVLGPVVPTWHPAFLQGTPATSMVSYAPPAPRRAEEAMPLLPGTVGDLAGAISSPQPGATPISTEFAPPAPAGGHWSRLPLFLWTVGAGAVLIWVLAGVAGGWYLVATARPVTAPEWRRSLAQARAEAGTIAGSIRLLEHQAIGAPASIGWWRPAILLPAEARGWSESRREAVLAHELAHVRRRDNLTGLVAHLTCAVHWFNPLAWYAAQRMRIEREVAADDEVLARGMKASDYSRVLLELAESLGPSSRLVSATGLSLERSSVLARRLVAILDPQRRRGPIGPRLVAGATFTAIGVGLFFALIGPDPSVIRAIETERERAYPRPPLGETEIPGDAVDSYMGGARIAENLDLYEAAGCTSVDQPCHLDQWLESPEGWAEAPQALRALAASSRAAEVASLVMRGAAQRFDRSLLGVDLSLDGDWFPFSPVRVQMVVRAFAMEAAATGRPVEAAEALLALLRWGQDHGRGAVVSGYIVGVAYQRVAAAGLLRVVLSEELSPGEVRALVAGYQKILASQPSFADAFRIEGLWRAQQVPAHARWRDTERTVRALAAAADGSTEERGRHLEAFWEGHGEESAKSMWRGLVAKTDRNESEVRLGYIALALLADRLERGRFAQHLDDLVPTFVPALPLDPVSGRPFDYEVDGDRALIRSRASTNEQPIELRLEP